MMKGVSSDAKHIQDFEEIHRKYLHSDGRINREGYKILCHAHYHEPEDKYYSYEIYHFSPRLKKYWTDPEVDKEYKEAWRSLHPNGKL